MKTGGVSETRANHGSVTSLPGTLPPQCRGDVNALRRFVHEIITSSTPADAVSPSDFKEVFLTGATGFVGRYMLHCLLRQNPELIVHCLVRADSVDEGELRLQTVLQKAELWEEIDWHRVRVIVGDINEHHFGLVEEDFADLCRRIDAIYHFSAILSLAADYSKLRSTNVFSIRGIIELGLTTRFKHVFYASTLGIFPEYFCTFGLEFDNSRIKDESQPNIDLMKRHFPLGLIGYPWSKLVSEQALLFAHAAGMPLAIFRLPITGVATSGCVNPTDLVTRTIAATIQVEMTPPGFRTREFGDPVDVLADICAGISMNPGRQHIIYHCCESKPKREEADSADFGIYQKEVSYPEFKRACLARGRESPLDGHWMLMDHFSKYWFYEREPLEWSHIEDQAVRNDYPNSIQWPSGITKLYRAWDWMADPENNWPYSLPKVRLEYDLLVERARSHAESMGVHFDKTYPDWMLEGLWHSVESMNSTQAEFQESRHSIAVFQLSSSLRENAELARERNLYPEIEDEQIVKPVFIVGVNRTGTTFLHRLMYRDPRFLAVRTFEMFSSVIPSANYASIAGTVDDPRRKFALKHFEATGLQENFAGMHPMEIDEPTEEFKLLALAFATWLSNVALVSPKQNEWLEKTGSMYAYPHHRLVMQHFNWQRRMTESDQTEKQWLFKMPFHLMEMDNLIQTYPDACFIQTHRPPREFIGSWLNIVENYRSRLWKFNPQSRYEFGIEQLNFMSDMMNRAIDFRIRRPDLEDRWIDINYYDFIRSPMKIVSDLYEKFGWPLEPSAFERMDNWRKRQAEQRKREVLSQYDLADYSLTPTMVDTAFENYLNFVEQLGL